MQIEHTDFQDQLVRGLSHRMNNILTLFHGYLGLLMEEKKLDKEMLNGLTKIKEGARAASELMDRTHSLVRPSTIVWREVDLGEMLRLLRPLFEGMRGPKTELQIRCPSDLPRIWVDAGRIKTAIIEIVRNAFQAAATRGVVTIEVQADEPGPRPSAAQQPIKWVSVTVTDTGPGIAEEVKERIFAPFFTTKRKQNAAGLGLTLAQAFVQQHGGVIRLKSEAGRTEFQILLPSRSDLA